MKAACCKPAHAEGHDDPLAELLADLAALAEAQVTVSVGEIMAALGARGHGPIILTLAALMMVPVGMLPMMPTLIGVMLALTAGQMLIGGQSVSLPAFIARQRLDGERFAAALQRAFPLSRRLRRVLHPRWRALAQSVVALWLIALYLLVVSLVMIVFGSVPGLPFLLCMPVLLFGLGLTAGDGLVVAMGFAVTAPVGAAVLALAPRIAPLLGF